MNQNNNQLTLPMDEKSNFAEYLSFSGNTTVCIYYLVSDYLVTIISALNTKIT